MSYVSGEAGNIFYEASGEGRPIVFVHGWAANHTFWEPQITSLCDEFRTIAIDLRGHGRSDKPSRGYAFDDHCKDLKRLMEELKVEDATLMGWSTGGGIATKYAATIKDHIIQLGLVGPTSPRFVSNPDYIHGVPLEAVRAMIDEELRDRPASRRRAAEWTFHKLPSMQMLDWVWMNLMQTPGFVGIKLLEELIREDLTDLLSEIEVPTGIFQGRHDEFTPPGGADFMAERIKDCEVIMFEALGHAVHLEDPIFFNKMLRRFLEI